MMQETREEAVLTASAHSIRVTEALRDGDHLTFIVISQKLSGTGEYHVDRTYEDFEWLHQHLFDQEEGPGIQGVIFPPLPVRPQVNASAKVLKQLGFLAIGNNWKIYCVALETYLQQVAAHTKLSKNKAVEIFLTNSEPPGRHKMRKGIFNRLSQAVEGMRKEGHKDVDDFFQTERLNNQTMTGCTKSATESFLDVVLTEQKIAVACGHLSTALHLFVENGEDPATQAFSRMCVKISEVIDSIKKNFESVADNNGRTLGQGLDLESRHQEAVKEMLFRRTCKLVELETASRNAERAKPIKKAAMEEVKKAAEEEFDVISAVAKQEIARFQALRAEMLRQALICWCETQLQTARESHERYSQHLQDFREMGQ